MNKPKFKLFLLYKRNFFTFFGIHSNIRKTYRLSPLVTPRDERAMNFRPKFSAILVFEFIPCQFSNMPWRKEHQIYTEFRPEIHSTFILWSEGRNLRISKAKCRKKLQFSHTVKQSNSGHCTTETIFRTFDLYNICKKDWKTSNSYEFTMSFQSFFWWDRTVKL